MLKELDSVKLKENFEDLLQGIEGVIVLNMMITLLKSNLWMKTMIQLEYIQLKKYLDSFNIKYND